MKEQDFARAFKAIREAIGRETLVAKGCNMQVWDWVENGEYKGSCYIAESYAKVLDIPVSWFTLLAECNDQPPMPTMREIVLNTLRQYGNPVVVGPLCDPPEPGNGNG
jgi:hypothetical protein